MNIPQIYLVEPYNAYAPKNRKKHPHEIIEEQMLLERIIADQIALQEAQSRTLPPNSPNVANAVVGNSTGGAGGNPPPQSFHPGDTTALFDRTPTSGPGPLTVQFINYTPDKHLYNFVWTFGDGTTSTEQEPLHIYDSGSSATDIYTASLAGTSKLTGESIGASVAVYTSASIPTVTSAFTLSGTSVVLSGSHYTASAGDIITFVNGSSTDNTATLTYQWNFGSASAAVSTDITPTLTYTVAGDYTVVLGATGSYAIKNAGSRLIQIV